MKIIKLWLGAFRNVFFSFTPSFFAKNFNQELSGSLTEKFNTPVRIVIIISRGENDQLNIHYLCNNAV